jgi:hypothetical protein
MDGSMICRVAETAAITEVMSHFEFISGGSEKVKKKNWILQEKLLKDN